MLWIVVMLVVVDVDVDGWLVSEGFSKREVLPHQPVGFVAIVAEVYVCCGLSALIVSIPTTQRWCCVRKSD